MATGLRNKGVVTIEVYAPVGGPVGDQPLLLDSFPAAEEYTLVHAPPCMLIAEPYFLNSTAPERLRVDAIMFHDSCADTLKAWFWGRYAPAPGVEFLLELYTERVP